MRLHFIIPVKDHETQISRLLKGIPEAERVMVVDYGSRDNTDALAKILGARVLYSRAEDPGAACQKALRYSNYYEPDAIVFCTPEQDPSIIPKLISGLEKNAVVVARDGVHVSAQDRFLNGMHSAWLRFRYGASVGSLAPFLAVRFKDVQPLHVSEGNGWHRSIVLSACKAGRKVASV
ncbi:MAG: hypothetical protein ABIA93_03515 [Candidatus Woesearchaeota archaeon]